MSVVLQERLPNDLVAEINLWQRKAREDTNNIKTAEGMAWVKKISKIISKPQYHDHVNELNKVRLP